MNVTCERCNTEYDFDDTLVSGRGTTVKCTNCGHLFKVRKAGADPAAAQEKWVVRTVDGRELQFNALRELQAAITQRTIGREDVLSRGGSSRPRRLGAIAELEPFFTTTGAAPMAPLGGTTPLVPAQRGSSLPSAHVPDPEGSTDSSDMQEDATVVRPPPVDPDTIPKPMFPPTAKPPPPPTTGPTATVKEHSPPPGKVPGAAKEGSPPPGRVPGAAKDGSPPPGRVPGAAKDGSPPPGRVPGAAKEGSPPPGRVPKESKDAARPPEKPPEPTETKGAKPPEKAPPKPPVRDREAATSKPPEKPHARPPTKDAAQKAATEAEAKDAAGGAGKSTPPRKLPVTAPASDVKISHMGDEEPRFSTPRPTPKRSGGGAQRIVAFVAVGVLIFVGVTAARRFMSKPQPEKPVTSATPDDRITTFLADSEKSLNEGDLEGAQSLLDKASALADKDPKVAVSLALVATARADLQWLKLRLLPTGDPSQPAVKNELDQALARARKAVENAEAIAPKEPAVARRKIDVLRIAGEIAEARKLVSSVPAGDGKADSAFVPAALDLAEEKPSWDSVIGRLRTAASGEHSLGRARSMLIYALVRSGDMTGAKGEYDQLAAMPKAHPLLALLREFIARSEGPASDAGIDAADLSPEEAIKLANELRAKGDSKRAEELFQDVLKKTPTSADAAAGLADIFRSRGDTKAAIRYYEQALKYNSVHLLALSGLADLKWDQNERLPAIELYRKVVLNGGSSPLVARARERLGKIPGEDVPPPTVGSSSSGGTPPAVTEPIPTAPPPATTTEPPPPPPSTTPPPATTPPPPPPPPPTNTSGPVFIQE